MRRSAPRAGPTRRPVASKRFMIAAAHPLAVDAGYAMLRQGGSAVDAAIAVQLVLGLVEPQSSGLGGGAFMLRPRREARPARRLRRPRDGAGRGEARSLPRRRRQADAISRRRDRRPVGRRSGHVALLEEAHKRHGRLPWERAVRAGDRARRTGFPVSPRLHALVGGGEHLDAAARPAPSSSMRRAAAAGRKPRRNPAYAATLRKIAAGGAEAFYEGDDRARHRRHRERPPRAIPAT